MVAVDPGPIVVAFAIDCSSSRIWPLLSTGLWAMSSCGDRGLNDSVSLLRAVVGLFLGCASSTKVHVLLCKTHRRHGGEPSIRQADLRDRQKSHGR